MKVQNQTVRNSSRPQSASFRTCLRTALTAPPTKRCCGSTATTSRLPWGPASSPSLGSGTLSDVTNGELPISWANKPQLSINLSQPSAPHPTPREAWNSLGQMSREEAMSAYITEMKLVAQKVIDTVPLGEVAEDMFGYFEPLYQVIPDMPRPPETFLRRVTESQPPRDQDSEVFCDSVEQLEPELVGEEQRGALGGENDTRNSPEPPAEKGRLEGPLLGPQELDSWLVGTVRALQESMRDVQGRLQSLESMPMPPEQQMPPPSARPRPLRLSGPTLIFFLLWPFIVQWLFRQFRTQKR
ncbi:acyl-CoA-binding domain-containing protein 4 isoform X5 [Bos indicus x Bos taurus]|uniref:acyl-CoA-binding domain-containing protein 4 isoform X5 n=1 Tax=Bos indicus x Bos taurus TaxID=30522 RepID=UPI000F7D477E|nr:acyl-CoA-binding domain-containing protein 4 isoform X5 [Bos indicus x Bos taurus]